MKRIAFVGGGQARTLALLCNAITGGPVDYVRAEASLAASEHARIGAADAIAVEIAQTAPEALDLPPALRPRIVPFPRASLEFLWPFAGRPHLCNRSLPGLPQGPYPAEFGDSYLNRMLDREVDPESAVARYLDEEIGRIIDLDALFEEVVERQRRRDRATGYQLADTIAARFRDEPLFLSPNRPAPRMTLSVAERLFPRLGVALDAAQLGPWRALPFLGGPELPIHPAVCRHFGLRFGGAHWDYRGPSGEGETFARFAAGYMRFETGFAARRIAQLIPRVVEGDDAEALATLEDALARWPLSAEGHHALAIALMRGERIEEAFAAVRRALALDPWEGQFHGTLSVLWARRGRLDEAIAADRRAIALNPSGSHHHAHLGGLLAERAQRMREEGEQELRRAIGLEPGMAAFHFSLSLMLEREGRRAEAAAAARSAAELEPENPDLQAHLHALQSGPAEIPDRPAYQ